VRGDGVESGDTGEGASMNEIKCPHCGEMFTIDEAGFAAILKQVRDAEFDKEVRRHEQLMASEDRKSVV